MAKNHRNRSWRSLWICEPISRTAVHKSGLRARVQQSPTNLDNDQVVLEDTDKVDTIRWDIGKLAEQAMKLWMERRI